ncbi:MAG: DNA gyrase subunit A [Christensenellaceae bacterium]|nr:DNA gyrase subunit A [Christensenellaceae bacterium]
MENIGARVIPVELTGEMQKSFISYAMAVIINRALPDVRDGLKPVHRRILYGMYELGVTPDKATKKCARIVGDVMGKYHPHGDSSIYDALVHMAQDFSMRYMLAEGQGNFGTIDGDGAAAMRYTEAKLSKISMEMLRDIDKDTVDFYPNFDETLKQPATLPARFPNLLVNGTGGIAVGMATNIPPHNLGEICDATCAIIDNPDIDIDELMDIVPGPDFPTGGVICGISGIRQAYRTGRGRLRIRAKAEIETVKEHEEIIVTEIPYQVNKEQMVAYIRELMHEKKIEGIAEVNDESAEDIRIVIELKRGVNANVILNQLYKHTQMQTTFGVINIALVNGEPKCLSLKQALDEYIKYQEEIIVRRTRFDLERAKKRAHILEGLIKALDIIDDIIKLIKSSKDANEARDGLMEKFGFSEKQAQAILDMRLQRLTGLERDKLEEEYGELMKKIAYFEQVLSDNALVRDIIKTDLMEIKQKYGDKRRTQITMVDDEIDMDELIQEEDMAVTLTQQGYIKRLPSDTYKSQRRGGKGITGLSTKEEDFVKDIFVTSTHNELLFFTTRGKVFMKKCYEIPEASRIAKGTAIVNLLQLDAGEKISAVFPLTEFEDAKNLVLVTKKGVIKKSALSEYKNIRQSGLLAIALREDDELISVLRTSGEDNIIIGTRRGMSITFNEDDVRAMGRVSMGVRGITLRDGDEVVDAARMREGYDVLVISENGYGKRTAVEEYSPQTRGGIGIKTLNVTDKTGLMCALKLINGEEDIMLINDANVIIRMSSSEVSKFGRATQGVRLMRMTDDSKVVTVAILPAMPEEEETEEKAEE